MSLPVKLQAGILSWVGDILPVPTEDAGSSPGGKDGKGESEAAVLDPCLSPADLFCLSTAGIAAGSPGFVIKDGFLGREQALRVYEGGLCREWFPFV